MVRSTQSLIPALRASRNRKTDREMRSASSRKQCFASNQQSSHNQGFAKQGNQELRPARSCQRNHEKTTTSRKNYEWSAFGKAVALASESAARRKFVSWSWRRDLNPRPSDYKSDALPAELRQRTALFGHIPRQADTSLLTGTIIKTTTRNKPLQPAFHSA